MNLFGLTVLNGVKAEERSNAKDVGLDGMNCGTGFRHDILTRFEVGIRCTTVLIIRKRRKSMGSGNTTQLQSGR